MRVVSQATKGEPKHKMIAPKVTSNPVSRMPTSKPSANTVSMPAGASTESPVAKLPSISP